MIRHLLTSSILITGIFMIRFCFGGRIRQRVKYALWTVVLMKLLLPFLSFEVPYGVVQAAADFAKGFPAERVSDVLFRQPPSSDSREQTASDSRTADRPKSGIQAAQAEQLQRQKTAEAPDPAQKQTVKERSGSAVDFSVILYGIWAAGACAAGLIFTVSNFNFYQKLKKSRVRRAQEVCPLDVYDSPAVSIPCLFGIRKPCIYLPLQEAGSEESLRCSILHEFTHYRHKDHIWALFRSICAALYWFHPLVWAAVSASARDAELACDEAVCSRMEGKQLKAYGMTLLNAAAYAREKPMLISCASHALRRKSEVEERICMMMKRPKASPAAGIMFCAAVFILAAGTFGHVQGQEHAQAVSVPDQTQAGTSAEREGRTAAALKNVKEEASRNAGTADQKTDWVYLLEADADSWVLEVTGCRQQKGGADRREKGYLLTGIKKMDRTLAVTEEEKQRLDSGETMTILVKSADIQVRYTLARGGKPEYASSDPDEAQRHYYILQAEDGSMENLFLILSDSKDSNDSNESADRTWTAVDADSGMEKRLVSNPEESFWVRGDTPVLVTNYYAYHMQGRYPENENDRRWTMQKYYKKYLKKLAQNNQQEKIAEIMVQADRGSLSLEECYLP